uniref:Uncharacterized protein n=1 Tax=Rhizophora mucronata TaxID=61149 RepID=A0A2P2LS24_RHIMU
MKQQQLNYVNHSCQIKHCQTAANIQLPFVCIKKCRKVGGWQWVLSHRGTKHAMNNAYALEIGDTQFQACLYGSSFS